MMNLVEKEIKVADIITRKLFSGEKMTEKEEGMLQEWLDESEEHRAWFRSYQEKTSYEEFEEIIRVSDQQEQWKRLESGLRGGNVVNWRTWMAYAAGIIILVSLGLWFGLRDRVGKESVMQVAVIEPGKFQGFLILNDGQKVALEKGDTLISAATSNISVSTGQVSYKEKNVGREEVPMEYNTIVVPRGGIYSLILSDGTQVFLNSDSELHYPVRFGEGNREVRLKGEAFFNVTPDSSRPFIVLAGEVRTRVLGTSFNILAYADEPAIETTLFTGRVEVSVEHSLLKKILTPGMQASWTDGARDISVREINSDLRSLWRDGIIVLDDDELESVMRMLARWYDVTYEWKGDRGERHTFTGRINRNVNLASVLSMLTLLGGPRFEIKGTTVYIY